jgi:hypothetical protein
MECARCLRTHGPGCAASYTDEQGEPICVFCLDQVVCPIARRIAAVPRAKRSRWIVTQIRKGKDLAKEERMTTTSLPTPGAAPKSIVETSPAPRICSGPGCKMILRPANRTGKCQKHRSHSKTNGAAQLKIVPQNEKSRSSALLASPAAAATQTRVCKVPGCGRQLVWNNATGLCKDHHKPHSRPHFKANGHGNGAAVDRANGLSPVAPGEPSIAPAANGHESAVEMRVNLVLASIPLEDKLALISGWLRGRECA